MKKKVIIASAIFFSVVIASIIVSRFVDFRPLIESAGSYAIVVYLLLQVSVTVLLCFAPGTSMTFIGIGIYLFGANWRTFVICFSGVIASSIIMDLIGRFGGSKIIIKLIGDDGYNSALNLLQTKGTVYIPVMYLLPIFPDDAICMVAGALKIKWWIHYIEIILCRGIGCATIVFGVSILPSDLTANLGDLSFVISHLWDYIVMVSVIVFWVILMLFIARKIDVWLTKHKTKHKSNK